MPTIIFHQNLTHKMRKKIFLTTLATALFASLFIGCDPDSYESPEASLSTKIDTVSYSLGYFYGANLFDNGIEELDYKNFLAGLHKALSDNDSELEMMDMQASLQNFQYEIQQKMAERQAAEASVNKEAGIEFLRKNITEDGVMQTDSGIQFRVITQGDGAKPKAESVVEVHYRGKLLDGTEFDSSHNRGDTAKFPLNQVIRGWTEGVQLMNVGSIYEFWIPSELAYGDNPPGGSMIPAGAVLYFEVELIDIIE